MKYYLSILLIFLIVVSFAASTSSIKITANYAEASKQSLVAYTQNGSPVTVDKKGEYKIVTNYLKYDLNNNTTQMSSGITIQYKDLTIKASSMTFNTDSEVGQLINNVYITISSTTSTQTTEIWCDKLSINLKKEVYIATSKDLVKLIQGKKELYSEKLTYFSKGEYAILEKRAKLIDHGNDTTTNASKITFYRKDSKAILNGPIQAVITIKNKK
jgi:lipopolysaccharide export system protein LptC